jgi:hypothetical protein
MMQSSHIAVCFLATLALSSGQLINYLEVKTQSGLSTGMFKFDAGQLIRKMFSELMLYCIFNSS